MDKDSGWEVFSLDYHVDEPIKTVFTQDAMNHYLTMFNFLWRLKRTEHMLSESWSRQMSFARMTKNSKLLIKHIVVTVTGLEYNLQKSQQSISEMVHCIYQLQYYMLFEVNPSIFNYIGVFLVRFWNAHGTNL